MDWAIDTDRNDTRSILLLVRGETLYDSPLLVGMPQPLALGLYLWLL